MSATNFSATERARTIQGVSIGILMLDTGFMRLPGDIGHGATWRFPVQYALMSGVTGPQVMAAAAGDRDAAAPLLDRFFDAANQLAALGVDGITTSCGFLVAFQQELAARCSVPVATSSLLQIPRSQPVAPRSARGRADGETRGANGCASGRRACAARLACRWLARAFALFPEQPDQRDARELR
jgi:hypothetical protein